MWIRRLARLSRSLQACAGMALLLVAAVAAAVIAVATRAGLAARREAIEIVHGLGATDGYIAARFAGRATLLAATGGAAGRRAGAAGAADAGDPRCAVRRRGDRARTVPADALAALPVALWMALPGLPAAAAAIGFITAHRHGTLVAAPAAMSDQPPPTKPRRRALRLAGLDAARARGGLGPGPGLVHPVRRPPDTAAARGRRHRRLDRRRRAGRDRSAIAPGASGAVAAVVRHRHRRRPRGAGASGGRGPHRSPPR